MPMMVASTGSFSVSGVKRALDPCTINTISPCPAPTVSTTTNVRPVPTRRSFWAGSTRSGSTVSSLRPVIDASFCVATTLPVTLAMNISVSAKPQAVPHSGALQEIARLPGDDQLLVGRHRPQLDAAAHRVEPGLALGVVVQRRIDHDAEPVEVGAD